MSSERIYVLRKQRCEHGCAHASDVRICPLSVFRYAKACGHGVPYTSLIYSYLALKHCFTKARRIA